MSRLFGPRATMGNIQWTPTGVTATFVAPTANMAYRRAETRLGPLHNWSALYSSLVGPFTQSALHRQVPVSAVAQRMHAAAPNGGQAWRDRIDETCQWVAELEEPPVEKLVTLTCRLPVVDKAARTWWPALATVDHPPPMPTDTEQQRARREADKLYALLAALVPGLRPATVGELRWAALFHQSFGGVEPPYTRPEFTQVPDAPQLVLPLSTGHMVRDAKRGGRDAMVHVHAPLLHETGEVGHQDVWQAFLVVNDFARRWDYPDAALFDDLDSLDVRMTGHLLARAVPNQQARDALNKFFKQTAWVESESEGDVTPHVDALVAREDLVTELATLAAHGGPATPAVIVVRVGGTSREQVEEAVAMLRVTLDPTQTRFARPAGQQTALWLATLPGSGQAHMANRYARHLHAQDLAGLGIFHGHELGDPDGRLYAIHASASATAPVRLVFRNPTRGPSAAHGNMGATAGHVGDMGAGKSQAVKEDADQVLAMGGGVLAIDTSDQREWTRAARAFPAETIIVDPADRQRTFDPLRTFTANLPNDPQARADMLRLAERHTVGFFALRLNIPDQDDDRYDALEGAVQDLLSDDPPLEPTSPNLLRLLRWRADDPAMEPAPTLPNGKPDPRFRPVTNPNALTAISTLVTRLTNLSRQHGKGRNIMGDGETLNLRVPAIIISDPGADYSTVDGRATIYLATAYAAAFMNATPRFNLVCLTEMRLLAENPWGERLIDDILTVSRRANSGLAADSQLARHFKRPELFIERTAARTRDEVAAAAAAEFVGAAVTPSLLHRMQTLPTGLKLYRDRDGNLGLIDVLAPHDPRRALLFRTDKDALLIDPDVPPEADAAMNGTGHAALV